jgi:hypothetical protein
MATTTLVKDVIWRASSLLQDTNPQFARWTEHDLVDWLNDGQAAICKYIPMAASRLDAVQLTVGTRQSLGSIPALALKPGDGSTPSAAVSAMTIFDVVRDMGANGTTPGAVLRRTQRQILDAVSPLWHTKKADVPSSWMYDPINPTYFYVTPGLRAPRWIEISYAAAPVRLPSGAAGAELYAYSGSSAAGLSISDEFVDDVVNYMVARANLTESEGADVAKATAFGNLFLSSINAVLAARTGTNPNLRQLPFAPVPLARAAQ